MAFGLNEDAAPAVRECANLPAAASPATLSALLAGEIAAACSYRRQAKAANTVRASASDRRQFEEWCDARGLEPLHANAETWIAALVGLVCCGVAAPE
jgi:hypothetical protein